MKVRASTRPQVGVQHQASSAALPTERGEGAHPTAKDPATTDATTFRAIYDAWFNDVSRWIHALGGPEADRDDIVQEVFMVVRRRLSSFDGGNLAGWLYRITRRQVRDFRRRVWVRHFFSKRRVEDLEGLPSAAGSPAALLEAKEHRRILHMVLEKMNVDRRSALVLFEIEGLSGEEIARIQNVPVNTVWTRLHQARKEFLALATKYRNAHGGEDTGRPAMGRDERVKRGGEGPR